jgi:hypothetical protein
MERVFSIRSAGVLCAVLLASAIACGGDDNPTVGDPANTGSVSGTVTFIGTWPATGDVQVAVYSSLPPTGPPDAYTNPLSPGTAYPTYAYKLAGLDPGSYDGVIVSWRDPSDPLSSRIIGQYSGGSPVVVVKGEDAPGFDIVADLDQSGP